MEDGREAMEVLALVEEYQRWITHSSWEAVVKVAQVGEVDAAGRQLLQCDKNSTVLVWHSRPFSFILNTALHMVCVLSFVGGDRLCGGRRTTGSGAGREGRRATSGAAASISASPLPMTRRRVHICRRLALASPHGASSRRALSEGM